MPSIVAGTSDGPEVTGLTSGSPRDLTVRQVRAYTSAFLEGLGIPQRTIVRALRIPERTHRRYVRAACRYARECRSTDDVC